MTAKLHIADGLDLPREAVTEKLAFLGRTGSGKSYAASKLAEEFARIGAQFVILDPVGIHWGLRLAADGTSAGIPLPVLGGLHGDVPLEPSAGALVADLIVDRRISCVLDVSQFESDADKSRFAEGWASRFFFRKKAAPSAVHVFVEEAQEFVPQNPQRGEERMLHAFQRLEKLGRNFGIGMSLISQRPQEVNKKALNQTELLFAFQMTGPQERKAVEGWIADKGVDEDIAGTLPKLARGEPHVWSPAWLRISETVKIGKRWTFDASSTPKVGKEAEVRELAPIDLERLRSAMADTIERAKADDPKALRAQIAALERANQHQARAAVPAASKIDEVVGRAVAAARAQWDREFEKKMRTSVKTQREVAGYLERSLNVLNAVPQVKASDMIMSSLPATGEPITIIPKAPPRLGVVGTSYVSTDRNLGKGEHVVLRAIAQADGRATREHLTVVTGYKRSTRDAYLHRLGAAGLIEFADGRIGATGAGYDALGPDFAPLPTGYALRDHYLATLPEGEAKILGILADAYPNSVDREALSGATGYARSSRDAYLHRLRARQLITSVSGGSVRAADLLFPESRR